MDAPQAKRGKLHGYELIHQFAPHVVGGQPKQVSKFVALPNNCFLSCSVDELKMWKLEADRSSFTAVGVPHICKRFTRGYTAVAVVPGSVQCLPAGGVVVAGIASPHEPNQRMLFYDLHCRNVLHIDVPGVTGIVSLAVTSTGNVLVGGLCGIAQELSFHDTAEGRCVAIMQGHEGEVRVCGLLPNGMVACGSAGSKLISDGKTDACLRIWHNGELVECIKDHDEFVRCFGSCGRGLAATAHTSQAPVFVTGSSDSSWVARTAHGQPLQRNSLPLNWNNERASILAVESVTSGTELQFVTGDDDKPGRMVVWSGDATMMQTILHPHDVCGLVVTQVLGEGASLASGGSSTIISVCKDGFVRVWSREAHAEEQDSAVQDARTALAVAVAEAAQSRLRLQQLQTGGRDGHAGAAGTVNGLKFQHTMSIALDGREAAAPPIRIGFDQVDFYKDVAGEIAAKHGLGHENTSQLQTAIRAQQEQAAGPPRSLGPPGERERPPKIVQRYYEHICARSIQHSRGGHAELVKKFVSLNNGLRTRGRDSALGCDQAELVVAGIDLLAKPHQRHRTALDPGFLKLTAAMLRDWPPKMMFIPFGILRLAVMHPGGIAWLASASNPWSLDVVLEHTASILKENPSPLVTTSAILFLVNAFATRDPTAAAQITGLVSTPRGVDAVRSLTQTILLNADCGQHVLNHWWSMCVNLTMMLEQSISGLEGLGNRSPADALPRAVVAARAASAPLLLALLNFAAGMEGDGRDVVAVQPAHMLQACRVLCNCAASGFIDKQASQFWASLSAVLQSAPVFQNDKSAVEEIECLLRYRGPIFEAF